MTVSPWLVVLDADALLGFLVQVFGAHEIGRAPGPDGRVGHAEVALGGSVVVVMDAHDGWPTSPACLRIDVAGCPGGLAGVVERAEAGGAEVVTPVTSLPVGDDVARVRDPWGNLYWLQHHVEDVTFETLLARLDSPAAVETMTAFEASLDAEMRRRSG